MGYCLFLKLTMKARRHKVYENPLFSDSYKLRQEVKKVIE